MIAVIAADFVIHIECWGIGDWFSDDDSGNTGDGAVWGNILKNDASGADFCVCSDFDIAEDLSTCANEDSAADFGMSIAGGFSGASECDFVEE